MTQQRYEFMPQYCKRRFANFYAKRNPQVAKPAAFAKDYRFVSIVSQMPQDPQDE